jgi:hypothetical protein
MQKNKYSANFIDSKESGWLKIWNNNKDIANIIQQFPAEKKTTI